MHEQLTIEDCVARHYAQPDLEKRILDALVASGKQVDKLAEADLAAVDEFHTGGRHATIEFTQQLGITSEMRILDVGCGIGGSARFLAEHHGCQVTGIDLTEEYVRTAEALTRRVALQPRHLPAGQRPCSSVRTGEV
jgi:2-polyprenyl-3-methyl-5-hydroxy-6-metoxy-1,4-benzoquinol methylase